MEHLGTHILLKKKHLITGLARYTIEIPHFLAMFSTLFLRYFFGEPLIQGFLVTSNWEIKLGHGVNHLVELYPGSPGRPFK